jgi:20S proteasome alpha/beta subunit
MTVCIAAICKDDKTDEDKIVLCTDRRLSSGLGSAETSRKDFGIGHGWRCLVSGEEDAFVALTKLYELCFRSADNLTPEKIDATIKAPLYKRKRDLAEEYVRKRFAISYDDFIKFGKDKLPPDLFHEASQVINHTDLAASLIIAGFLLGAPEIYYTDPYCGAHPVMNFATIGEGANLAHSVLMRRGHISWNSMSSTLYSVWEAKKAAEAIGSVGPGTNIAIVGADGSYKLTSHELDAQLAGAYLKYGPQRVPSDLRFDGDFYYKKAQPELALETGSEDAGRSSPEGAKDTPETA